MKNLFTSFQRSFSISQQLIALICTLWFIPSNNAPAQQNGIYQSCDFIITETGAKFIRWHAKTAHTYFIQVSDSADHLRKWNYAPLIESGYDHEISHEVNGIAEKGFFRLHYTDQAIPPGKTVETADFDSDGLTNSQEIEPPFPLVATCPLNSDTDGDGLSDGFERTHCFDPNDANPSDPNLGPAGDPDNDGLTNLAEASLGTDPNEPNTDNDTLDDGQDADPTETLIDWQKTAEPKFAVVELVSQDIDDLTFLDLSDKGTVAWSACRILRINRQLIVRRQSSRRAHDRRLRI
jgi:Bacterial TSP3 repeat